LLELNRGSYYRIAATALTSGSESNVQARQAGATVLRDGTERSTLSCPGYGYRRVTSQLQRQMGRQPQAGASGDVRQEFAVPVEAGLREEHRQRARLEGLS
jgi:hypothetical protein